MEFRLIGTKVECYRLQQDRSEELVTSFDAHLSEVAPHVAGALTTHEVEELNAWFESRRKLASHPQMRKLFDRLEKLSRDARRTLHRRGTIESRTVNKIDFTVAELKHALEHSE